MNLNNIQEYIEPVIYKRGENYFESGAVVKLERSSLIWDAVVSGMNEYHVTVQLDKNNEIVSSSCNCPYARTSICKHKAAALLAIAEKININLEMFSKLLLDLHLSGKREFLYIAKKYNSTADYTATARKVIDLLSSNPVIDYPFRFSLGYFLIQEKEWKILLSFVQDNPWSILDYKPYLFSLYPEKVYCIHMDKIRKEAQSASKRKAYRNLCNDEIKYLYDIGGKTHVAKLIQEFRGKYRRRTAN